MAILEARNAEAMGQAVAAQMVVEQLKEQLQASEQLNLGAIAAKDQQARQHALAAEHTAQMQATAVAENAAQLETVRKT